MGMQGRQAYWTVQFLNQKPGNGGKGSEDLHRQHRAAAVFQPPYRHLARGVSPHMCS